ncbi:hypothetical protein ACFSL6_15685 [Paenibacillus thailandensis]|uniref:Uncharacterized protein n=1 Tax=Paenibacillus thailandensis TaxID=393250 RepID=A0ABW5QXX3_9BACL
MRYTVQYIPLSKIKAGGSAQPTRRIKELRIAAQDFMHLLIVRKSRKHGGYVVVGGQNHYEYFKQHTKKKTVPCLVDESKAAASFGFFANRFRLRGNSSQPDIPHLNRDRTPAKSLSIIRAFLNQQPRFKQLSRRQQFKVIRLGLQYKKTTVKSMNEMVDGFLRK